MCNTKKRGSEIIILRHNGGQLCNQLLLFISIYAFCLEKGFTCINFSFYEYNKYFNFPTPNIFVKFFELINNFRFSKSRVIVYNLYKYAAYLITFLKKGTIIKADPGSIFYLPPTKDKILSHQQIIRAILQKNDRFYIDGWTFRNPVGIKKYRNKIIEAFRPKREFIQKANKFIDKVKQNNYLIGVHIRQGEYKSKNFEGGAWYFNEREVAEILKEYLKKEKLDARKVLFILCSDGLINLSLFSDLNIKLGPGLMIEDLIVLSKCNLILGSNSTFGSFSAYFGNIPFFIFDRQKKYIKGAGEHLFQMKYE